MHEVTEIVRARYETVPMGRFFGVRRLDEGRGNYKIVAVYRDRCVANAVAERLDSSSEDEIG